MTDTNHSPLPDAVKRSIVAPLQRKKDFIALVHRDYCLMAG